MKNSSKPSSILLYSGDMSDDRVTSGIEGLDKLLFGGFPKGRAYLVSGEPGTGKTIFTLQFLLEGARNGEKGIFVTIDEKPEHIVADMISLGWDVESYLKNGLLQILDVTKYFSYTKFSETDGIDVKHITEDILGYVKESGATRLAIDPIAPLVFTEGQVPEITDYIRRLIFSIESNEMCTTLLTSYVPVGSEKVSQHGIEEFAASGIILLKLAKIHNKPIRTLMVRKMRGTRIELSEYSFEILPQRGVVLRQPI
jgi:circadian clock protein KaiC